jgi:hypothetical protein
MISYDSRMKKYLKYDDLKQETPLILIINKLLAGVTRNSKPKFGF